MKKSILILVLFVFSFYYFVNAENKLTSSSFEITDLTPDVNGFFKEYTLDETHMFSKLWLKVPFVIKNISGEDMKYQITIERIAMNENHILEHCIAGNCYTLFYPSVAGWENGIWISDTLDMQNGFVSNPDINSYIAMSAGEFISTTKPGVDTFKVTYKNVLDDADYVSFTATWRFDSIFSIGTIKDVSNQIFPNPANNIINFTSTMADIDDIEIYDITGDKVANVNVTIGSNYINISHLKIGNYIGFFIKDGIKANLFRFTISR